MASNSNLNYIILHLVFYLVGNFFQVTDTVQKVPTSDNCIGTELTILAIFGKGRPGEKRSGHGVSGENTPTSTLYVLPRSSQQHYLALFDRDVQISVSYGSYLPRYRFICNKYATRNSGSSMFFPVLFIPVVSQ